MALTFSFIYSRSPYPQLAYVSSPWWLPASLVHDPVPEKPATWADSILAWVAALSPLLSKLGEEVLEAPSGSHCVALGSSGLTSS